jgi:hypothetical protein
MNKYRTQIPPLDSPSFQNPPAKTKQNKTRLKDSQVCCYYCVVLLAVIIITITVNNNNGERTERERQKRSCWCVSEIIFSEREIFCGFGI